MQKFMVEQNDIINNSRQTATNERKRNIECEKKNGDNGTGVVISRQSMIGHLFDSLYVCVYLCDG